MTTFDTNLSKAELKLSMSRLFLRKRLMNFALPAAVLAYLAYVFFAFDVPGLWEKASLENARTLVSDSYSYKTHVTRDNRSGDVSVAVEGERKGAYPDGMSPDWVDLGETTV
ncbi:MAG: phosphonate ABC transporter, permease protein PhnE, partial [Leisingera sp.]